MRHSRFVKNMLALLILICSSQVIFAQSPVLVNYVRHFKPAAGDTLRSRAILYDLGKYTIQPASLPFLDSLVTFLQTHPQVTMQINRHGDYTDPERSMRLGLRRAQAIQTYLISKGIAAARLEAKDYGLTKPLIAQNTINREQNTHLRHRMESTNKRTEFVIVKTDYPDPGTAFTDTLFYFVTDSFRHNVGQIKPVNTKLRKPFKYIGTEPAIISRAFTGDPHFICEYPKEVLVPGKVYWMTVCFWHESRRGKFVKHMGFELTNGQHITFEFSGEVLPPE